MTPADSPERDQALASIARHGALGAAVIDLNATRAELGDAIQSLVASVLATVAATQERDRLRRQVEAVRALCDELETSTGRLSVVQVAASIRAALAADGAGSLAVPHVHVQESTPRHQVTTHPQTALKSTMGDPQ